jgi:Nucleotidyltransferase domain
MQQDVLPLCRRIADDLAADGARAVVLVGSHARHAANPESDVDLLAIGSGPGYQLSHREGRLISLSWRTEDQQREQFRSPRSAVTEIPGWRSAVIIKDSDGIAARLQREAVNWTWDQVAGPARQWVAAELTGYAEEVHKLVAALRHSRPRLAAVQRNLLALHLPMILAVHFETLHDSENEVWDAIAHRVGESWRSRQDRALSLDRQSLGDGCRAALEMYAEAVRIAGQVFNDQQRSVVAHAVALARESLEARGS